MDSILVNMFVLLTEFLIFLEIEQDLAGGEGAEKERGGEREDHARNFVKYLLLFLIKLISFISEEKLSPSIKLLLEKIYRLLVL